MRIEEIRSSRRGQEVERLAQSLGAERAASSQAIQQQSQQSIRPGSDAVELSSEAAGPLGALSSDSTARTTQILTSLEQSFQGNSQDRNQRHRPREQAQR